jgi:hypothetical protein
MAYQMRVDTGAGGDILEYLIDFHHMGTGDLYSVNFYMIKDGQLIQTLTPPTGVGMSVLLGVWYGMPSVHGSKGEEIVHQSTDMPRNQNVQGRIRACSRISMTASGGTGPVSGGLLLTDHMNSYWPNQQA